MPSSAGNIRATGPRPVPGRSSHDHASAFKSFERVRRFQAAARRDVAQSLGCGLAWISTENN